jgi:hypothetical protein
MVFCFCAGNSACTSAKGNLARAGRLAIGWIRALPSALSLGSRRRFGAVFACPNVHEFSIGKGQVPLGKGQPGSPAHGRTTRRSPVAPLRATGLRFLALRDEEWAWHGVQQRRGPQIRAAYTAEGVERMQENYQFDQILFHFCGIHGAFLHQSCGSRADCLSRNKTVDPWLSSRGIGCRTHTNSLRRGRNDFSVLDAAASSAFVGENSCGECRR